MSHQSAVRESGRLEDAALVAKEIIRDPVREAVAEAFAEEAAGREESDGGSRRPGRLATGVLVLLAVGVAYAVVRRRRSTGDSGPDRESGPRGSATVESQPTDLDRPETDRPAAEGTGRAGSTADEATEYGTPSGAGDGSGYDAGDAEDEEEVEASSS